MTRPRTNRGLALPCQSIQEARQLYSVARSGCAASSPTSRKCNESFPEEEHCGRVVEQMAITGRAGDSPIPTGGRIQARLKQECVVLSHSGGATILRLLGKLQ